jgi:hypothetical protein
MKKLNHFAIGNAFSCSHQDGYYAFFRRHAELLSSGKLPREKIPESAIKAQGMPNNFFWTLWTLFLVFPESLTRKLYRKKIPEIVKMVSMVPGPLREFFKFLHLPPHITP